MSDQPHVTVRTAHGRVRAVALVLHGGRESGHEPTRALQLSVLRMIPFAQSLTRAGAERGLAVWRVRYRARGWNTPALWAPGACVARGAIPSPVRDLAWVLEEVERRHPGVPVVLVGHSMGARTALRVGGDPAVRAVAALAPWLPQGEPVAQLAGRRLLLAHGADDHTTSPRATHRYADRARAHAAEVTVVDVPGENHAMLRHPRLWHRLATDFVLSVLQPLGDHPTA